MPHAGAEGQHSPGFMLEEYRHLADSYLKNEELGERRVDLFLAFAGLVAGGLAAGRIEAPVAVAALLTVLALGIVTLKRLIRRNLKTDEYLRALGRVRRYFADLDAGILDHLPYPPSDDAPQRRKAWREVVTLGGGGLVETVQVVNSAVAGVVAAAAAYRAFGWATPALAAVGLAVAAAAWVAQFAYVKRQYDDGRPPASAIRFPTPREIESTLVVVAERPADLLAGLRARETIGAYRLAGADDEAIRDRYFDAEGGSLRKRRLALRVREVGARRMIGLKGPPRQTREAVADRMELELPWSRAAAEQILGHLRAGGIDVPALPAGAAEPIRALEAVGLRVVQDRETHRVTRRVESAEGGRHVADLAIDTVTYHVAGRAVLHREVEVEAKGLTVAAVVADVTDALAAQYGAALAAWEFGKFQTGMALEHLAAQGALEPLLGPDGGLRPEAYGRLRAVLAAAG